MKEFWILIAILIVGAGIYFFINKKNSNEPYPTGLLPRIEKTTFSIQEISTIETTMLVKMVIDNRAPVGFSVNEINYVIFADGKKLAESPFEKEINFEGNETTEVEIPVKLKNQLLLDLSEKAKETQKDSAEYKISANLI